MSKSSPVVGYLAVACALLVPAQVLAQAQPAPGGQWDEARGRKFEQAAKAAAEQTQANLEKWREKDRPVIERQQRINEEQERKRQEKVDAYWKAKAVQNRMELEAARGLSKWKIAVGQGNMAAADQAKADMKKALGGTEHIRKAVRPIADTLGGWAKRSETTSVPEAPPVAGRPVRIAPAANVSTQPPTNHSITLGEGRAYEQAVRINEALKNIDLDRIGTDIQPGRAINTVTEKMLDAVNRRWDGGSGAAGNTRAAEIARINQKIAAVLTRFAANEARRIKHNADPNRTQAAADAGNAERAQLGAKLENLQRQLDAVLNR